jgi:hypothetical protein
VNVKTIMSLALVVALSSSTVFTQAPTLPTQAEIDQWKKDPAAQILETSPCKKITWVLQSEHEGNTRVNHDLLGWWGRGWIEGAAYILGGNATDKANEFGLSVNVVAAYVQTYCAAHPTDTPYAAIQDLMLKVLK